ncbi:HepT-like ribonuclease domain-containing protein [Tardiphaga alba]|uniref:HepT-like ribonuclease domain-containing protein n=1 Tax=Tardiphaga alba TaxID=340268 RepID=UPI0038B4DCB6
MPRPPLLRIHDMLDAAKEIERAIRGMSDRDYQRSWVLRSALERGIEIISEASRSTRMSMSASSGMR